MEEILRQYLKKLSNEMNIELNDDQTRNFYVFMQMLLEWNEKINLTAIIDPKEIILKHFIDSLTIIEYIKNDDKLIDVGTGAGFPGIPLSIANDKINITLMDSLNKRINFLKEVKESLKLDNINTIHSRAEELGQNKQYREKYDIATSRAVANLTVLVEYLLPFVKIGGKAICMKGSEIKEELKDAKFAIKELGGKIIETKEFLLPNSDMRRNIIIIEKIKNTPRKYPRKAGTPSKQPLK